MNQLRNVFSFGWPYLKRYWVRLIGGVLCGMLFGMTTATFVWAVKTIVERLEPQKALATEGIQNQDNPILDFAAAGAPGGATSLKERLARIGRRLNEFLDPWLPKSQRPLDWRQIAGLMLLFPILMTIRSTADYLTGYCMGWVSERVINDMRAEVLTKLTALSMDYFTRSTVGDMLTRINTDTMNLHRALRVGCADLVKEPFTVIGAVCAMLFVDWKLTLFALVFLPLCFFPLIVLGKKARRASSAARKANVSQNSMLVEVLTGIRVIKAFTLESQELDRFRAYARQMVRHGMKGVQAKELVGPLIVVISTLGIGVLLVYVFWSGRRIPELMGFMTGLMYFYNSVKRLSGIHILFEQAAPGVDRLIEISREQPTVIEPARSKSLPAFTRELRLDHVNFAYRDELILKDLDLAIPRGFRLGVAGESGSGKSTLTNLLFRFYDPTSGRVTLDGVDLRELSFAELRKHMALVSQDIFLFDMTVAENIACGKPGATQAEIEAAARAAYAHDFIMQLEGGQGYGTRIGERGATLSGGQRQRLCIARAFVRNAPILVLDEATASLDSQSEAEVQAAIDRLAENRTVISIAHRLSTLASMDEIIVISEGRITERGTFQQLLAAGGQFADMARRQGIAARSL
jgi:subfamily B ATP-binding cassette protein MsbA